MRYAISTFPEHDINYFRRKRFMQRILQEFTSPVTVKYAKLLLQPRACLKVPSNANSLSKNAAETWNYSFGKFLEMSFYCTSAINQAPECTHSVYRDHIRAFSFGTLVAQFSYETIQVTQYDEGISINAFRRCCMLFYLLCSWNTIPI